MTSLGCRNYTVFSNKFLTLSLAWNYLFLFSSKKWIVVLLIANLRLSNLRHTVGSSATGSDPRSNIQLARHSSRQLILSVVIITSRFGFFRRRSLIFVAAVNLFSFFRGRRTRCGWQFAGLSQGPLTFFSFFFCVLFSTEPSTIWGISIGA